ncbi:MAG: hypothetical protein JWN57_241 [Frankiales bacterium]|nr:hypothetical protein [Frankiales bacterium]
MTTLDIDPTWCVGTKAHGGYLLSSIVGPALDEAHPHPMAVSAHYLSSPDAGSAELEIERVRTGRRVASSRLRLAQNGKPCVEVLLTAGKYDADAEPYWTTGEAPVLPPVEDCLRAEARRRDGVTVGFLNHVDMRMDPETVGYATGSPHGKAMNQAWLRRDDGGDPTLLDLLIFADSLPPVTFDLGLIGWVPTVELTVLVRGLPAPGWCRAVQRARLLQDGWLDEECEVWDSAGRLVVQARQLAGYRLD